MHACMHVCMYACMNVCIHACVCVRMYVFIDLLVAEGQAFCLEYVVVVPAVPTRLYDALRLRTPRE